MTPERFEVFLARIQEENDSIDNHFMENPEFAHLTRMADALGTIVSFYWCVGMRQHWDCLVQTTAIVRHLYVLSIIKPQALEAIYAEFREDFEQLIPNNYMFYSAIESHEYPVPEHLYESTPEPSDGLDDC